MPPGVRARWKAVVAGAPIPAGVLVWIPRLARIAAWLGVIAIIVLSLVPGEWRPSTGMGKPLEHAVAYALAAASLTIANRSGWRQVMFLVVLAGVLEIGQIWVPGRDAKPTDFLASAAGAVFGFAFGSLGFGWMQRMADRRWMNEAVALAKPSQLAGHATVVAVGAGAAAASILAAHGAAGWLGAGLALIVLAIAAVDGKRFLIPDSLNAAAFALGVVYAIVQGYGDAGPVLADAALRALVLALLFLGLRLFYARLRGKQGIGLGDVKLAAVAGVWLDWSAMPIAVEIAAVSALAAYGLRCYVLRRRPRSTGRLPFGLFFAPAIWVAWLLQTAVLPRW